MIVCTFHNFLGEQFQPTFKLQAVLKRCLNSVFCILIWWFCTDIIISLLVAGRTLYVISGTFRLLNRLIPLNSSFALTRTRLGIFGWNARRYDIYGLF